MSWTERVKTGAGRLLVGPATQSGSGSLAPEMLQEAVFRFSKLLLVLLILTVLSLVLHGGILLAGVERHVPFITAPLIPRILVTVCVLVAVVVLRRGLIAPSNVMLLAAVFELGAAVVISFVEIRLMIDHPGQAVGLGVLGLVTLVFRILIPHPPRRALLITLTTAAIYPGAAGIATYFGAQLPWGGALLVACGQVHMCAVLGILLSRMMTRWQKQASKAMELGSYQLEAQIGAGGMGTVWRARHRMLKRAAAIKLITLTDSDPARQAEALQRFEREAQATAALRSTHTVEVYDFGASRDGSLYYVMELLDGLDLQSLVQQFGAVSPARAVHYLSGACASLIDAHGSGVIHRDLKPANLFACRLGCEVDVLKVVDFGLASLTMSDAPDSKLTMEGRICGTPAYMPPEIAEGRAADERTDIYMLGAVAFWLLTGRLVFPGEGALAMIAAHLKEPPPAPSSLVTCPPELDALVLACLAKDPADRPSSARELRSRLRAIPLEAPWTEEDADLWWRRHQPQAKEGADANAPTEVLTVVVA